MAKSPDKPEGNENTPAQEIPKATSGGASAGQPQRQQRVQVQVDDAKAMATYANFCRVTGTPEELIIDFGFTPQPTNPPPDPIAVTHRVVMNLYTAKRLLQVLQLAVQRHESAFGVLETDVRKRIGRI